jgi:hypothetical protein
MAGGVHDTPSVTGWMGVRRQGSAVRVTYARRSSSQRYSRERGSAGMCLVVCDGLTTHQAHKHQRPPRRVAVFTMRSASVAALRRVYIYWLSRGDQRPSSPQSLPR